MDTNPHARVAGAAPFAVELEAGKSVWLCRCGHSADGIFCDGSHNKINESLPEAEHITPLEFTPEESKTYYVCACKRTGKLETTMMCDGSHAKKEVLKMYNQQLLKANSKLAAEKDELAKRVAELERQMAGL